MFLLVAPGCLFSWVGEEFSKGHGLLEEAGETVDATKTQSFIKNVQFEDEHEKLNALVAANFERGDLPEVNTEGEESEDFWDQFEAGY